MVARVPRAHTTGIGLLLECTPEAVPEIGSSELRSLPGVPRTAMMLDPHPKRNDPPHALRGAILSGLVPVVCARATTGYHLDILRDALSSPALFSPR